MIRKVLKFIRSVRSRLYVCFVNSKYRRPVVDVGAGSVLFSTAHLLPLSPETPSIVIAGNTIIRGELMTFGHGGLLRIGDFCIVGAGTRIWAAQQITIGNRVLISHGVNIFDSHTHPLDAHARHLQFRAIISDGHPTDINLGEAPVVIEDDALICAGAIILRGVKIGRGAIVGAGAVVTRDVAPHTVVAGNPARVIRQLDPV